MPSRDQRYANLPSVTCIAETEAAILVQIDDEEVWIPRSQLHPEDNEVREVGDVGELVITEWIAEEKGLV